MSFPYNFRALPPWHTLENDVEESAGEEYLLRLSLHVGVGGGGACVIVISAQNPSDDSKKGMIMLALMMEDIYLVHQMY